MAIPNTNGGWSLETVRTEVSPSKNNLDDLIAIANAQSPSRWDPVYSGSKNSLLNFRNYGAVTTQRFHLTVNASKVVIACTSFAGDVAYHNGTSGGVANLGDTIYSNEAGTIPYPAGSYGQTLFSGGLIGSRIVVDNFGVVTAYYLC